MRYFRQLPPLLRMATILGGLLAPMALVLWVTLLDMDLSSHQPLQVAVYRPAVIALNLGLLSLACYLVDKAHIARAGRLGREPFPLDSWWRQALALGLLAALPLGALTLAVVTSPTLSNLPLFLIPFAFTIFEWWVFVAYYWMLSKTGQTVR